MKHLNWSLGKVVAAGGLFVSRRNWFLMVLVPAIPGQSWALGILIGTHNRHGLLLGNRWILNGQKRAR